MLLAQPAAAQQRIVPNSEQEVTLSFAPLVKKVAPAVVNIFTSKHVQVRSPLEPLMADPVFRRFFGRQLAQQAMPQERVVSSLGSGVLVRGNGILVTSSHVIEGADEIRVVLNDKREFSASLIVADPDSDLALLQIDTKGQALPYLTLSSAESLQVGDLVLAIGNPFGVGQTVTSGIVSALARAAKGMSEQLPQTQSFIQTDAAINPGNSGGALVDMKGALVGINTAIYSRSGGSLGIGFAVPGDSVLELLLRNGK